MYMNLLIKNFNTDHFNILMIIILFGIALVTPLELLLIYICFSRASPLFNRNIVAT